MPSTRPHLKSSGDLSAEYLDLACPCCTSAKLEGYWAVMAPLIRVLAQPSNSSLVKMMEFSTCGHRFFSYQFTSAEMSRLYSGYRGEHYLRIRNGLEPWYGKKINEANRDPSLIRAR